MKKTRTTKLRQTKQQQQQNDTITTQTQFETETQKQTQQQEDEEIINEVSYAVDYKHKTVEEKYTKMSHLQHILEVPDTYIGSVLSVTDNTFVYDPETNRMIEKEITYNEGLYKIYDEILVNAFDQCVRLNEKATLQSQISKKLAKPTPEVNLDTKIYPTYNIYVDINVESNTIRIRNDGEGIPAVIHKDHGIYVPELIFGNLLTGSNYDKAEKRITGGKNGYGSKICNIFSSYFRIETIDIENRLKYEQTFTNNMSNKTEPVLTKIEKNDDIYPYTEFIFSPDLKWFKLGDDDIQRAKALDGTYQIMIKRVYDISACVPEYTNVYLNGQKLQINKFEDYVNMFIGADTPRVVYKPHRWWDVVVSVSNDHSFEQVSFVNGCWTIKGGKHVDYISKKLSDELAKHKNAVKNELKAKYIKDNMTIFVKCHIINPSFNSQTKTTLITSFKEFGSRPVFNDEEIAKMADLGILERASQLSQFKIHSELKKTDGVKKSKLSDIEKLTDADYAGTAKSSKCALILTEGDSAKTMALKARGELTIEQQSYIGIFPLRGKMLNVKEAKLKTIMNNEEIKSIKRILGLKQDVDYSTNISSLRYGSVIVMTDADADGDHIKGLFINFIHCGWRSLLMRNDFIKTIIMPIVKVYKKNHEPLSFYTLRDFEQWTRENNGGKGWEPKYFKGLGSYYEKDDIKNVFSTIIQYMWKDEDIIVDRKIPKNKKKITMESLSRSQSVQSLQSLINGNEQNQITLENTFEDVSNVEREGEENENDEKESANEGEEGKNEITYIDLGKCKMNICDYALDMAFKQEYVSDRKIWLQSVNPHDVQDNIMKNLTFDEFINERLKYFSIADNERSIPSIIDGFKPGQRKIIYGFINHGKIKDTGIKVSQIAGKISEMTEYEHGEQSLYKAIISMAQDYVGSNNLNLLSPLGSFGTRVANGEDSASPRYIFVNLEKITNIIFNETDNALLKNQIYDGELIEPEYFAPILPMVLMNGSIGIGTGFSTDIPQFHPFDICNCLIKKMKGLDYNEPIPWYRGFRGTIAKNPKKTTKYDVFGKYEFVSDDKHTKQTKRRRKIDDIEVDEINKNQINVIEIPIGKACKSFTKYKSFVENLEIGDEKRKKKIITSVKINEHVFKQNVYIEFDRGELMKMLNPDDSKLIKYLDLKKSINISNMELFNVNGKLQKYNSVKEIIDEFYEFRLGLYNQRLELLRRRAELKYAILCAKIQFMMAVSNDEIIIYKRKKDVIVKELEEKEYPKYNEKWKELGYVDDTGTYDYLLHTQLTSFTEEQIEKIIEKRNKVEAELDWLDKQTGQTLWLIDIKKFKDAYIEKMKVWYEYYDGIGLENDPYAKYFQTQSQSQSQSQSGNGNSVQESKTDDLLIRQQKEHKKIQITKKQDSKPELKKIIISKTN